MFKEISPKIETKENTYLENICTYMSFMNCLFKYTTFIFFNLKCFLEEEELEDLYKFSNYNKLDLLLCENVEREKLNF
ncbi:MAG: type II-A CRISPR-associated protein Csn2, partial [Oscillospiraceae bacterium]